jgi:hypothetical protein
VVSSHGRFVDALIHRDVPEGKEVEGRLERPPFRY